MSLLETYFNLLVSLFFSEIGMGLQGLMQPYLLKKIIDFIKKPPVGLEDSYEDITWGIMLVIFTAFNQLTEVFISKHVENYTET